MIRSNRINNDNNYNYYNNGSCSTTGNKTLHTYRQ